METTTHQWRIENFSRDAPRTGTRHAMCSKSFPLNGTRLQAWMQFDPKNVNYGPKPYSSVHFCTNTLDDQLMEDFDITLWMENVHGKTLAYRSSNESPMIPLASGARSYFQFVHQDELYPPKSRFIEGDVLIICCAVRPKNIPADRYAVVIPEENCPTHLIATLSKDNVLQRLHVAFIHNNAELKEAALEYITKPDSDAGPQYIFVSEEWQELFTNNPQLANKIMAAIFKKVQTGPKAP